MKDPAVSDPNLAHLFSSKRCVYLPNGPTLTLADLLQSRSETLKDESTTEAVTHLILAASTSTFSSSIWMRDEERGTSEKNVNMPLSAALDLPFPFLNTWIGLKFTATKLSANQHRHVRGLPGKATIDISDKPTREPAKTYKDCTVGRPFRRRFGCKAEDGRLILAAVALQDHITRSICVRSAPLIPPTADASFTISTGAVCRKNKNSRKEAGHSVWTKGEETEYVLDRAPPPLSLAQRIGLVAPPSSRLTTEEWAEVKTRSLLEGDSSQPCVICREQFCLQPQVLLSCSHVFHKVCLRSFEKFSGRKCCPMCRREQIQAFWRGYLVRKWYTDIRKHVPPKDQLLRRRFFEKKFQELNASFVRACSIDVDGFIDDIDCSVAMSHDIQRRFNRSVSQLEEKDWQEAHEKAAQRGVQDCPICLNHLDSSREGRSVLLLSCSHLFHEPCLLAFELFCQELKPRPDMNMLELVLTEDGTGISSEH
ncbi:hypothetical protein DNTS_016661 [Danionella cerebrum]|uniref:RING-type domain-containing protein n=1 Tax=Danionella cerebrum TaxID=2873325 RepID=A0A553R9K7_9TELE|nr:hypothetical protein DNTS_016661 [Danionella translucida]